MPPLRDGSMLLLLLLLAQSVSTDWFPLFRTHEDASSADPPKNKQKTDRINILNYFTVRAALIFLIFDHHVVSS